MSTLWSGRVCWAAALALLVCLATANNAIVASVTEEGHWDVSLNITDIDLMPGLDSWDDLSFSTLQQEPWFSDYNGSMAMDMWEKLAVLDLASGTLCQDTVGCMDDIASHYQSLCDAESQELHVVEKRFLRYIAQFASRTWHQSKNHVLQGGAIGALASVVAAAPDGIIKLGRSAICGRDPNGNQGCISWAGGVQAIKQSIAVEIISSAQGTFGGDAVSAEEYGAVFDNVARRAKRSAHDVCISNRAKHCT
jgi:hypothetical protein